MDNPTEEIICGQLKINLKQFMEEIDAVLKEIKCRKAANINKIQPKVWETRKFDVILL